MSVFLAKLESNGAKCDADGYAVMSISDYGGHQREKEFYIVKNEPNFARHALQSLFAGKVQETMWDNGMVTPENISLKGIGILLPRGQDASN